MSDHADKLRDILELTDCSRGQWEPSLDALVAELAEARRILALRDDAYKSSMREEAIARAEAAEKERDEALRRAEGWVQHDTKAYHESALRSAQRAEAAEARVTAVRKVVEDAAAFGEDLDPDDIIAALAKEDTDE